MLCAVEKVWAPPRGQKPEINPTNLTYSTLVMWWKGLGGMIGDEFVEWVGLGGGLSGLSSNR